MRTVRGPRGLVWASRVQHWDAGFEAVRWQDGPPVGQGAQISASCLCKVEQAKGIGRPPPLPQHPTPQPRTGPLHSLAFYSFLILVLFTNLPRSCFLPVLALVRLRSHAGSLISLSLPPSLSLSCISQSSRFLCQDPLDVLESQLTASNLRKARLPTSVLQALLDRPVVSVSCRWRSPIANSMSVNTSETRVHPVARPEGSRQAFLFLLHTDLVPLTCWHGV